MPSLTKVRDTLHATPPGPRLIVAGFLVPGITGPATTAFASM